MVGVFDGYVGYIGLDSLVGLFVCPFWSYIRPARSPMTIRDVPNPAVQSSWCSFPLPRAQHGRLLGNVFALDPTPYARGSKSARKLRQRRG